MHHVRTRTNKRKNWLAKNAGFADQRPKQEDFFLYVSHVMYKEKEASINFVQQGCDCDCCIYVAHTNSEDSTAMSQIVRLIQETIFFFSESNSEIIKIFDRSDK